MMGRPKDNALALVTKLRGKGYKAEIGKALPEYVPLDRFMRMAATELRRDAKLAACTPESLKKAVIEASHMGLCFDSVLGHAYIIPYKGEAKFQLGYKGYIILARRSGAVNHVETAVVYKGDDFSYRFGTRAYLDHTPVDDGAKRGEMIGAWCKVTYPNGLQSFDYMPRVDIEAIRVKAPGSKRAESPWNKHPGEMYRKTVMIRHLKTRGISPEITFHASQEEQYHAGLGMTDEQRAAEAKEVEAEEVQRGKFKDTMANGQSVEGPKHVDSESEPVPEAKPATLTAKDRSNLIVDHHRYSMAIGRKRLPMETLEGMSDSALADAVENLRQLAEEKTNAENHAGDDPGDVNPFHD
jgi:recombination protein RecT